MTEPVVGDGTGTASAVDRDALEKLTRAELHEQYNVPETGGQKADWVQKIVDNGGQPLADEADDGDTVNLQIVNSVEVQEHYYDPKRPPITADPTPVPAGQVQAILAGAATGGVQIREVN